MNEFCYTPLGVLKFYFFQNTNDPICNYILTRPPVLSEDLTLRQYLPVFAITCILEFIFYASACARNKKLNRSWWGSVLATLIFANFCTHPLVYVVFPWLGIRLDCTYVGVLLFSEIFAPVMEALILKKIWGLSMARAFAWMGAANLFSWWVGIYFPY